jgi:hypothetical protein
LPGPVFFGNSGANQATELFGSPPFGSFSDFAGELGGGITAPFMNPADNIFNAPVNTSVIPEPAAGMLTLLGMMAIGWLRHAQN